MKPATLLSFLKEEVKYNEQIIKEKELLIKRKHLDALAILGHCTVIMFLLLFIISFFGIFFSFNASLLLSILPMIPFGLYQAGHKKSLFNKLENKIKHKCSTQSLFDINRLSKVSDEHLNQIKLSLTLDQYKALHIKHPNPCYQDVINFLENIDDVNTIIAQAEESKNIIISTDNINMFKKESVHNVIQL